jgi:hypothetical protein
MNNCLLIDTRKIGGATAGTPATVGTVHKARATWQARNTLRKVISGIEDP